MKVAAELGPSLLELQLLFFAFCGVRQIGGGPVLDASKKFTNMPAVI